MQLNLVQLSIYKKVRVVDLQNELICIALKCEGSQNNEPTLQILILKARFKSHAETKAILTFHTKLTQKIGSQ